MYIIEQDTIFNFEVPIKSPVSPVYACIICTLLFQLNPSSAHLLQDKLICCWGAEEPVFFFLSMNFSESKPFDNSLPICLSSNQTPHYSCCVLWLPPRPCAVSPGKHQGSSASKPSPSFLTPLQMLSSNSCLWSFPTLSLFPAPKLNPSSPLNHPKAPSLSKVLLLCTGSTCVALSAPITASSLSFITGQAHITTGNCASV